jgi:hypothetical protein
MLPQENGKEVIEIDPSHHFRESRVTQYLSEWVMLSQSSGLVARGKVFEARDKVLALLKDEDSVPQRQLP